MDLQVPQEIQSIPINTIRILNPRARNPAKFAEIIENIKRVGLKRPVTIRVTEESDMESDYDLVCGQGRIEAFQALGQTHIPAIVIHESEETALLKSLVENLARRQHRPMEHFNEIKVLQKKGYNSKKIAAKTGLNEPYAKIILDLLKRGEERLLAAVAAGHLPVSVAIQIASSPENEQQALHEAYDKHELRGEKLRIVQKLLENRKIHGKNVREAKYKPNRNARGKPLTGQDVMKIFQKEVDRKQSLTRKADQVSREILFITEALKQLMSDDKFTQILRKDGLDTIPKQIADLLKAKS